MRYGLVVLDADLAAAGVAVAEAATGATAPREAFPAPGADAPPPLHAPSPSARIVSEAKDFDKIVS
jgi:hypothetical protein